jgi:hypothetical protein
MTAAHEPTNAYEVLAAPREAKASWPGRRVL